MKISSGKVLLVFALIASIAYAANVVRQTDARMKSTEGVPVVTATVLITFAPATATLTPAPPLSAPNPNAPLCASHTFTEFHTLYNDVLGCHYDHEHGQNPFTQTVTDTFPSFNLFELLGSVQVGHTNPSSEMENSHKHGGMKWDVTLSHSAGCVGGGSLMPVGVNALVVQYHNFGDYSIEFESRLHSAVGLLRQCLVSDPSDYGYVFVNQHQDYGQRITPYQGTNLLYPDAPIPPYQTSLSPYFSTDCFGNSPQCRPSLQFVLSRNANASSTWTSRPQAAPIGSTLFSILFRVRDTYQLLDWSDLTYPFTFRWLCSNDGGLTYAALVGCRHNNSTSRVHEVHGEIPEAWDNTPMDSDIRVGRITAEGYVTPFGLLNPECVAAGPNCHPFKFLSAFTGKYFSAFALDAGKGSLHPNNVPERDVCFNSSGALVNCDAAGAIPSGWIGSEN